MLKKCISLFKYRTANIDLILESDEYLPGGKVSGHFHLQGGWMKQTIKRLECDLVVRHSTVKNEKMIHAAKTILMSRTLDSGVNTKIPFTYQLPETLKPSSHVITYRFKTRLIFSDQIKSIDHDIIKVQ